MRVCANAVKTTAISLKQGMAQKWDKKMEELWMEEKKNLKQSKTFFTQIPIHHLIYLNYGAKVQ